MKHKRKSLSFVAALTAGLVTGPAFAVIDDAPYFNLWEAGVESAGKIGQGDTISLCGTTACSGATSAIDYAVFTTVKDPDTARGSGNINPFLRFQHNEGDALGNATIERAFNTSNVNKGTITSNGSSIENQAIDTVAGGWQRDTFNHAIKLSDLLAMDGQYSFLLDINEPGGNKSLLRLDELAFFISTTDQLNEFDRGNGSLDSLQFNDGDGMAYKVWDMDFNALDPGGTEDDAPPDGTGKNFGGLMLDNINDTGPAGSGDYDLQVQLQAALFDQAIANAQAMGSSITADNAYVYLYNWAGEAEGGVGKKYDDGEAQAGFEEWAAVVGLDEPPGDTVPEPATALLIGGGLLGLFRRRRRS